MGAAGGGVGGSTIPVHDVPVGSNGKDSDSNSDDSDWLAGEGASVSLPLGEELLLGAEAASPGAGVSSGPEQTSMASIPRHLSDLGAPPSLPGLDVGVEAGKG
ncbi:unnamed protein product, partial [Discosporangium mesarthrocarpum]